MTSSPKIKKTLQRNSIKSSLAYSARPDRSTVRRFVEACPPFRALVLAVCLAQYEHCIKEPNSGPSYRAGCSDLLMAVYLPYCDQFVTGDHRQERCLTEIGKVAGLTTEIRSYEAFRSQLTTLCTP